MGRKKKRKEKREEKEERKRKKRDSACMIELKRATRGNERQERERCLLEREKTRKRNTSDERA